ncbi:hemolysin family protein [Gordonia sp. (in: high G+C Gram-positive bacteria)]|uniref:hemolysin family protein n=1 Tax=Gordonia sp. (in: high G+C Gram-positive bacteria) TaxID=84139 RepID=UPI0016B84C6B|nr:hemolysin family protein [Gordonia sp. (in: high G+C Gram-positive bacteria)]NLG48322.1 HlyC/CorC family transporter [Gordonia sp. (in: high G+C Gram-positive bacteria)]
MLGDIVYLLVAVLLTAAAGTFAATDAALATVSAARIDDLVKDGRFGASRLKTVIENRGTYVGLAVLLRVLCEASATAMVAVVAVDGLGTGWGIIVTVLAMTVILYIAVGVGPRTLGRQNAYSISLVAAPILTAVGVLLRPVTRLLILIGNAITPGKGYRNGPFATEVEVREVVDMAEERGVVDADERRMIQSVFEFGDTDAREVMVPRPEMIWIENDKSAAQAMSLAVRSGHSRIPVIGENPDDVLGVVYLKDVVERLLPQLSNVASSIGVDEVMRDAEFVPDSKPLDDVLSDMQANRNHMALLVDEYGGIAGLVTIEDVLEEIVGEISDEYDIDEIAPIEELGDGVYRVSSRLPVEDLEELFDVEIDLDLDDVDTVGGLLALRLGRVPLPGAKVKFDGLRMVAEGGPNRLGRQRITTVVVRRTKNNKAAAEDHQAGHPKEN